MKTITQEEYLRIQSVINAQAGGLSKDKLLCEQIAGQKNPEAMTAILQKRHSTYGVFMDNALLAQQLKDLAHAAPNWGKLKPDQKESLDNIMQKIARALSGDPDYLDNWTDMAGYASLVRDRMLREKTNGG